MKVESSRLIEQKKPLLKKLLEQLLQKYSYASILMTDSHEKVYSVSKSGINIKEAGWSEKGYVVKVYDGTSYGEYAFSQINENDIDEIVEKIGDCLMPWKESLPAGFGVKQYPEFPDDEQNFEKSTEFEIDPRELGMKRLWNV